MRDTTIPTAQAWNTWSSLPAEMVFLPLGVSLAPVGFAGSTGTATLYPPGPATRFGRHAIDGACIEIDLHHAGTTLRWAYAKTDPFIVTGAWEATALGEWGLRFWINLCLRGDGGQIARFDPASGCATLAVGSRVVALATAEPAVQITGHATLAEVAAQYEAAGYFDTAARADAAPVLALRFNLEMTRRGRFALAVADSPALAIARARAALTPAAPAAPTPLQTGRFTGALDAVRDVLGWNTVWNEVNRRPYISISRNWNLAKFGGFGVWLNDQQYAAMLAGLFDAQMARGNLAVALASATPQGNLACLLTAKDAWVDRTQLPVGGFLVWLQHLRDGDRAVLEMAYDTLARNHHWWWAERDPQRLGLVSFGTSDVGDGMYKGTAFGARNESSMDNAAHHDQAEYDPISRTLTTLDVGLNSLLALDAEMLALIARTLGRDSEAATFAALAERTNARIRTELWDERRGLFANRLRSGAFVRSVGPTSFYPLASGAPTPEQRVRLVAHLDDPATFGGAFAIPGTSRDDPAFADNTYWRGRIWPPLNYWVWQGLRRAGLQARADRLTVDSFTLFDRVWQARRLCPENYNATTGEPLDQPDTEGFYTWGALLPLMGVAQLCDVSPWDGWALTNGPDATLGPLQSPAGLVTIMCAGGWLTLRRGTTDLLRTTLSRLTQLRLSPGLVSLTVPEDAAEGVLQLPGIAAARVVAGGPAWRPPGLGGGGGGRRPPPPRAVRPDQPASGRCGMTAGLLCGTANRGPIGMSQTNMHRLVRA
jgi:putative isomerase